MRNTYGELYDSLKEAMQRANAVPVPTEPIIPAPIENPNPFSHQTSDYISLKNKPPKIIITQLGAEMEQHQSGPILKQLKELEGDPNFNSYLSAQILPGVSPLPYAAAAHNFWWINGFKNDTDSIDLANFLMDKDPNLLKLKDGAGRVPSYWAAVFGDFAILSYFLSRDCRCVDMLDNSGFTPLHAIAAILRDIQEQRKESMDDPNKQHNWDAIEARSLLTIKELVDHGGRLDKKTKEGQTFFDMLGQHAPRRVKNIACCMAAADSVPPPRPIAPPPQFTPPPPPDKKRPTIARERRKKMHQKQGK